MLVQQSKHTNGAAKTFAQVDGKQTESGSVLNFLANSFIHHISLFRQTKLQGFMESKSSNGHGKHCMEIKTRKVKVKYTAKKTPD